MTQNPSAVVFASADHGNPELTGYEIDIIAANAEATTIVVDKSKVRPADELAGVTGVDIQSGDLVVDVNVQPIAFGQYTVVVRAVAGIVRSPDSEPSEVWERAPGRPTKPQVL